MAAYRFALNHRGPFYNGADGAVVVAPNATDALALVKASNPWATEAQWDAATITDLSVNKGEDFQMILNLGTVATSVVGGAAATIASLSTAAAAAITTAHTFAATSASGNVITIGTADAQGSVVITGSIVDSAGVPVTGFAPTINAAGTVAATVRTITWPADATLEWPAVEPVRLVIHPPGEGGV